MVQKIFARASNLLHDMGDQAEIALDEDVPGFRVALPGQSQVVLLLLGGEGLGEAACGELQGIDQRAERQPNCRDHGFHLHLTLFAHARPYVDIFRRPLPGSQRKKGL